MKISEIITDKYKLRIPPTVYYELLADVQEVEDEQESAIRVDCISRTRAIERLKLNFPISQGADNSRDRHRYMQAMADIQAIREMPSVTPQEPILDKIRAEIIERKHLYQLNEVSTDHSGATGEQALKWVLETIDKLLSEQAERSDKV